MEAKLTLRLDKDIIEEAKKYARTKNISLSRMVEKYLKAITEKKQDTETKYTPLVEELSGIIHLDEGSDIKGAYTDYLIEKYQ
ncbi:MAG: hypothetical protein GY765_29255 [bacterium]|nr:hypothetical protein [bacterium]